MNYKSIFIVLVATIVYAVLDLIWIGYFMKDRYINWLIHILRPIAQWNIFHGLAAVLTWLLIVMGVFTFVIPLVVNKPFIQTFLYGALFGAIVYGLYETTNYALIYAWQPAMVFADTLWGACACGMITLFIKYVL